MINLYQYTQLIPVFRNSGNEGLENTEMFNDHIVLHRNMKNRLKFKLTDRDRRSINLDNEKIKIKIVDDESTLVVDTFYLYPTEKSKIFAVELDAAFVNQLLPRFDYSFVTSVEMADGTEEVLYMDHDFQSKGSVEVVDNYSETDERAITGFTQRVDHNDKEITGDHYLTDYIHVDDDFLGMEVKSYDGTIRTDFVLQRHKERYFPVSTEDDGQWKSFTKVYDSASQTFSKDQLSKGYYRLVLTDNVAPEDFFVIVTHIVRL